MKNLLLSMAFVSLLSCNPKAGDCADLPQSFGSYDEAVNAVENAHFKIEQEADTSKSSWVRSAKFYSCNGEEGYFIISTDDHEYIHEGLPIAVWNGFKNAESFGRFYNTNIKHHYRMVSEK